MAEAARLLEAAFSNDCKALRLYLKKGHDGAARSGERLDRLCCTKSPCWSAVTATKAAWCELPSNKGRK
eukprot:9167-Heterococcus_DN1.PRE.4